MAAVSTSTVRNTLVSMRQSVDKFITTEIEQQKVGGINTHLEAARQVSLGIENAMVAYNWPGDLDKATALAPPHVAKQLVELSKLINELKVKNDKGILDLYSRVQGFILSLNLHSWEPRYAGTLHQHVYVKNNCFDVCFTGLFKDAVAYNGAQLSVGENKGTLTQSTEGRLNFSVKLGDNYLHEKTLHQPYLLKASLEVGYNLRGWFPKKAQYDVYIGLRPLLAANATLSCIHRNQLENKKQTKMSPTFTIDREKLKIEGPIVNQLTFSATPGWQITGTPKMVLGDTFEEVSTDKYSMHSVGLELSLGPDQQKIEGYVEFEESQPVYKETIETQPISLKWGVPFQFEAPAFKLNIKPLEGEEVELTETTKERGCFKVIEYDGKYQLVATPPEQT
jgi:hypothetical protein